MYNTQFDILDSIFIDIETVPQEKEFSALPDRLKYAYETIYDKSDKSISIDEHYFKNASLYPEFLKIFCVAIGRFISLTEFKVSIIGEIECGNESVVLAKLNYFLSNPTIINKKLVAHNGKNFDYPIIIKRMLINGNNPCGALRTINSKPWESKLLDTMEIWKFGSYSGNHLAPLDRLCAVFGVPSPKTGITGDMVGYHYYSESTDNKMISEYCMDDVVALALCMGAMNMQIGDPSTVNIIRK